VADLAYDNDIEALLQVRRLINFLPGSDNAANRRCARQMIRPIVSRMALNTLIPENPNKPYDMYEAVRRVVDEGGFL